MFKTEKKVDLPPQYRQITSTISEQLQLIFIHIINLLSSILGNDFLSCILRKHSLSLLGIKFGDGTTIRGGSYFYGGGLTTGINCQINRNCYFDFTQSVIFGNNVVIGHGVTFITAEHKIGSSAHRAGSAQGKAIIVEDGVWIGANSTVLPGITVGAGSVIAAGAMITRNVPSNVVMGGVPAKKIKDLAA